MLSELKIAQFVCLISPLIICIVTVCFMHITSGERKLEFDTVCFGILFGSLISILFVGVVASIGGIFVEENDTYFHHGDLQEKELNGIAFKFVDQRYIEISLPADFYGRVSILNTANGYGLFSTSVSKEQIYSKNLVPKIYKIDTNYKGTLNEITVEVENKDKYESRIYNLNLKPFRSENSKVFDLYKFVRVCEG